MSAKQNHLHFSKSDLFNTVRNFLHSHETGEDEASREESLRRLLEVYGGWTFKWRRINGRFVAQLRRRNGGASDGFLGREEDAIFRLTDYDPEDEEKLHILIHQLTQAHLRGWLVDTIIANKSLQERNKYLEGVLSFCSLEGRAAIAQKPAA